MFRYVGDEARHRVNLWSSSFQMIRLCLLSCLCVMSAPRMPWLGMSMMGCQCHRCAGSEIEWPWVRVLSAGPCLCCCLEWDTGQLTAEPSQQSLSRASSCTQTQVRDAREERRDRPGGQEAQEKGRRRQGVWVLISWHTPWPGPVRLCPISWSESSWPRLYCL